jgi:hypothetical protein
MNTKTNSRVLDEAWRTWHIFEPYVKGNTAWAPIEPKVIEAAKGILRAAEPQEKGETPNQTQDDCHFSTEGPIDNLADEFMGALTGLDGLQGSVIQECIEDGISIERKVVIAKEAIAEALNLYVSTCYLRCEQP